MGTVITAADLGRPLVALPRRASLGEVTSDHQSATARWLIGRPGITIVEDEMGLSAAIEAATQVRAMAPPVHPAQEGRDRLVITLRKFLLDAGAGINTTRS
jgi:UDP-N-acetylglucosamine transferase subunit ALG13